MRCWKKISWSIRWKAKDIFATHDCFLHRYKTFPKIHPIPHSLSSLKLGNVPLSSITKWLTRSSRRAASMAATAPNIALHQWRVRHAVQATTRNGCHRFPTRAYPGSFCHYWWNPVYHLLQCTSIQQARLFDFMLEAWATIPAAAGTRARSAHLPIFQRMALLQHQWRHQSRH